MLLQKTFNSMCEKDHLSRLRRLQRISQLIRMKATGSAEELAQKINISIRGVPRHLNDLKRRGAKIKYDRQRRSYVYLEPFRYEI